MENNKQINLIQALKEYNKSLSEQINRLKAFIDDIDKQLAQHKNLERKTDEKIINTSFSRQYLLRKVSQNFN